MKNVFLALMVGYVIGAKTGGKELEELGRSVNALFGTDEFADVVSSARSQVGSTLRELASVVDDLGRATIVDGYSRTVVVVSHADLANTKAFTTVIADDEGDAVLKVAKGIPNGAESAPAEELRRWLENLNDEDMGRYKM